MVLHNNDKERYSRQIALPQFGEQAQIQLLQAKVLVIGAGGLGCPVLQYLVAAGVGKVGIVDNDVVALSNLHRQILYGSADIGLPKAQQAAKALRQLNPTVTIEVFDCYLHNNNALALLECYDLVVDGTDNFASRYLINDACVLLQKSLIYGSIHQFEGQVAVFNAPMGNATRSANYRDVFPNPPSHHAIPNCNDVGVVGVLPGIVGAMMANECIKLITGMGDLLINELILYSSLTNQIFKTAITPQKATAQLIPADKEAFRAMDYSFSCDSEPTFSDVDMKVFCKLMSEPNTLVIDVREPGEKPLVTAFEHINIPLRQLKEQKPAIGQQNILLFCHSGIRSVEAALLLSNGINRVYNLKGGIIRYSI